MYLSCATELYVVGVLLVLGNRPFYNCVLSYLPFE